MIGSGGGGGKGFSGFLGGMAMAQVTRGFDLAMAGNCVKYSFVTTFVGMEGGEIAGTDYYYKSKSKYITKGEADNGLPYNRLLRINGKGNVANALNIGDVEITANKIPRTVDGTSITGVYYEFEGNRDIVRSIYEEIVNHSSFEWSLTEYRYSGEENTRSRIGTIGDRALEFAGAERARGNELLDENRTRLKYWIYIHNHPVNDLQIIGGDEKAQNYFCSRYPNAGFHIIYRGNEIYKYLPKK